MQPIPLMAARQKIADVIDVVGAGFVAGAVVAVAVAVAVGVDLVGVVTMSSSAQCESHG